MPEPSTNAPIETDRGSHPFLLSKLDSPVARDIW